MRVLMGLVCLVSIVGPADARGSEFAFDRTISRDVLENYLSRAVTHAGLCSAALEASTDTFEDDLRMLTRIGAKFIGRASFAWGFPEDEEGHFRQARERAARVHAADPDIILQACVFEIVTTAVERVPVPAWVFKAFDLEPESRHFDYEAMLYPLGLMHNHWNRGSSVPDMAQLETRLWFFYRAARYIDAGHEAIHFGQVHLMNLHDPAHRHWRDMLTRVRRYAAQHARRHIVLCDAHTHGVIQDGKLLFDLHSFPLRIKEVADRPIEGELAVGYLDSPFGRSKGGLTPSGWACQHLPYLAEVDNFGYSGHGGEVVDGCWIWGYDEISWFARQTEDYRNRWLRYAYQWVREHDPNGFFQIPTRRILAVRADGRRFYAANTASPACPDGFNQEDTIRGLWTSSDLAP